MERPCKWCFGFARHERSGFNPPLVSPEADYIAASSALIGAKAKATDESATP